MGNSSNSSAFNQNVMESTWTGLINKPGFPVSPEQSKIAAEFYNKYALPPNSSGAAVNNYAAEVYANGLQGADFANQLVPGNPVSAPATSATPETLTSPQNPGWTFITAPEDISWDVANQSSRVDIFGTNNPPVVAGSRGMIDLSLGNALVEGFVRNVNVEGKIVALQKLMEYKLNASDGFVSVPVYWVTANEKKYGGSNGGYFIIKDVRVKETMRDLSGNTTRAYVDVSFTQVPYYQVNTGRDQASVVTAGGLVRVNPVAPGGNSQANNASPGTGGVAGSLANGGSQSANAQPAAGAGAGGNAQTSQPRLPSQAIGLREQPQQPQE